MGEAVMGGNQVMEIQIRRHLVAALPIHFTAWVILICSLSFEPFHWFLIPNVNNTPAFITVSKWILQSLFITNLLGFCIYKLQTNSKLTKMDWKVVSVHLVFLIIHIVIVSILIFLMVGFEDL
jgi:hypothetical protein